MAKNEPTDPTTTGGSTPVTCTSGACCPSRSGNHEISGNFNRIFQQYARSTTGFATRRAVRANLPSGVTWENYYYNPAYKYQLAYQGTAGSRGRLVGRLTVTIRARATAHAVPRTLLTAAPALFRTVTAADITRAFVGWNAAVQQHWTNRRYKVIVSDPDCPGDYIANFVLTQVSSASGAHRNFTVLNQTLPQNDATWGPILSDPRHARHATAQALRREGRSNAIKFNMGDARGNLVFAHEYGHWIGWGDEYIEGGLVASTTSSTGSMYVEQLRGRGAVPPRVAIRFVNPTQVFQAAHGTNLETVDITVPGATQWLMSSMATPHKYPPRFIYTVVDDFIRSYNRDHYGGRSTAFCVDVK